MRMALCTARFMARRNEMRCVSWWAMLSPTSCAESSGRLISSTLIAASLPVSWASSSRSLSTSAPRLPITTPGRPVCTVMVTLPGRRSTFDLRDGRVTQAGLEVLPDQLVFLQERRHVPGGEPPGRPLLDDAEPEPDRMCLLTHDSALLGGHVDFHVTGPLADRGRAPLRRRGEPLERLAAVDERRLRRRARPDRTRRCLSAPSAPRWPPPTSASWRSAWPPASC